MSISKMVVRCISVFLTLTFITGQVFAGQIAPSVSSDKLSLSSVFDQETNPGRTAGFAEDIKPGAIANGKPLVEIAKGNLPTTLTGQAVSRLMLEDWEVAKLREAIMLAMVLSIDYSHPEYQKIVDIARRNLVNFNHSLLEKAYLYNLIAEGPEDYAAGFGYVKGFTGLTKELVDRLSPRLLAQYVWHELAPESEIVLKEIKDERSAHRIAYKEIQTGIFGEEDVIALRKEIRAAINEKLLPLAEANVRTPIIGGNWKMAIDTMDGATKLITDIRAGILASSQASQPSVEVIIAPSFSHLSMVAKHMVGLETVNTVKLAAQDVAFNESGAFTGQTSVKQLKDLGVTYIILGHSERRRGEAPESSELINKKAQTAIKNGFSVIVCVGEDLKEFEAGKTQKIIEDQVRKSLAGLTPAEMKNVVIAYEPVWAIGTGKVATPEQANDIQRYIRALLLDMFGFETAAATRIQYGGSVKGDNIKDLSSKPNIDGALIGGASLKAEEFVKIIETVGATAKETPIATQAPVTEIFRPKTTSELRYGFDSKKKEYTNTDVSYIVGPWIKKVGKGNQKVLPDVVVNTVKAKLAQAVKEGKLKGIDVRDFGASDIDIQVTHNYGTNNLAVHYIIYEAVIAALRAAKETGYYKPYNGIDILSLPYAEQMKQLNVRADENEYLERGSESVCKLKLVGADSGAANILLYRLFAIPGKTPRDKLGLEKTPGSRFIVQKTKDIIEGNPKPKEWVFEISTIAGKSKTEENDAIRLLMLLSQPNDYQIVAVYPIEGSALPANESLATVIHHPVFEKGAWTLKNPTIIFRSQSGAEAVGGIASAVLEPCYVPGSGHFVTIMPVTAEEARRAPPEGIAYATYTGWESFHDGEIPPIIRDHVAMNPPAYVPFQKTARYLAGVMKSHGEMQPYLSPQEAERRTEKAVEEMDNYFADVPKETDIDPFLELMEKKIRGEGWVVVGDDKADMGGFWGHTGTPEYMVAIYKATIMEAIENGEISDGNTFGIVDKDRVRDNENRGIGDDGHIVVLGDNSIYGKLTHHLSFRAFTRAFWYASANVLDLKPYGLAQDYQGPEAKIAKANPEEYSKLSERFFELLQQYLPESELSQGNLQKSKAAWENWKKTGVGVKLDQKPFSGNVTQQGIGTVRYAFNPEEESTFDIIGGDKTGPAALNFLIQEGVFAAVDKGEFKKPGLVFEIWDLKAYDKEGNIAIKDIPENFNDVESLLYNLKEEKERGVVKESYHDGSLRADLSSEQKIDLAKILKKALYVPNKRIFLDAVSDRALIKTLLAHSDRFNVRHVWTKKGQDFNLGAPIDYLDRIVLCSSVTKLGLLAGGEYVGKDDPVIVGNTGLMGYLHEFLRTRPIIVQGDMNGSHWEWFTPSALHQAVATLRSHPIVAAVRYTVSKDGKKLEDVKDIYGQKTYDKIRAKAHRFNVDFNNAQEGQFEPHGTNAMTVEASYPLEKALRQLNDAKSPFLVANRKGVQPIGNIMRKVYETIPAALVVSTTASLDTAADVQRKIIESRKEVFMAALTRILAEHPDQVVFVGIESDMKPHIMPLYKAIDELKTIFPNLMLKRGSGKELVQTVQQLSAEGMLDLNNAFIGAREISVKNSDVYDSIKGTAWIAAINDSNEGDYLPIFEAITLNMMAYLKADEAAIRDFYDAISDKPIEPGLLQDMIKNRIFYLLPKITKFDTKELKRLYELVAQVYTAA